MPRDRTMLERNCINPNYSVQVIPMHGSIALLGSYATFRDLSLPLFRPAWQKLCFCAMLRIAEQTNVVRRASRDAEGVDVSRKLAK